MQAYYVQAFLKTALYFPPPVSSNSKTQSLFQNPVAFEQVTILAGICFKAILCPRLRGGRGKAGGSRAFFSGLSAGRNSFSTAVPAEGARASASHTAGPSVMGLEESAGTASLLRVPALCASLARCFYGGKTPVCFYVKKHTGLPRGIFRNKAGFGEYFEWDFVYPSFV
jgi:hypothetical protein